MIISEAKKVLKMAVLIMNPGAQNEGPGRYRVQHGPLSAVTMMFQLAVQSHGAM